VPSLTSGMHMRKAVAQLVSLFFLAASCVIMTKPAFSSADVAEDAWATKAPMHQARGYLGVAAVNGRIYAIVGSTQQGSSPDDLKGGVVGTNEEYSPATNTWTFKASMPTPRYFFATAVYQNKIYCIGGYTSNGTATGANEVYDPATDTWETKTAMPTVRIGLEANAANGKIYLIGGYVPAQYTTYNFSSSFLTLNEVYDPVTDTWATKASIPTASSGYSSTVVDNKIYVIDSNLNQIYNSETDTWSQGASSPSRIGYGKASATNGVNAPKLIYVLGQDYSFSEPPYVNCVYDPANDTWTTGAAVPTKRTGFGVAVVNDVLYAVGGSTETFDMYWNSRIIMYAANEMYTPFGYGTVPPKVQIVSPENMTYETSNVSLAFTVNKQVSWTGFSVDGGETVTITGNVTLGGLANDVHNVTVYAKDMFGNTGASETVSFTVDVPESFPTALVATASGASAALVGVGLVLYLKKRKR
jgi:N-acetylneuraminic acid mutarotase